MLDGTKSLSAEEVAELTDAYLVLRKTENAVQMIRDEQQHSIPSEPSDRARLCVNLGVPDWAAASARIDAARRCVTRQFESLLLGGPEAQRKAGEEALGWLESEGSMWLRSWPKADFQRPRYPRVARQLELYRHAAPYRRLDEAGRRRLRVILQRLLNRAASHEAPATVVERVLRVLDAIGARSSYLALLKEQPPALDRLIDVCAISAFSRGRSPNFRCCSMS